MGSAWVTDLQRVFVDVRLAGLRGRWRAILEGVEMIDVEGATLVPIEWAIAVTEDPLGKFNLRTLRDRIFRQCDRGS